MKFYLNFFYGEAKWKVLEYDERSVDEDHMNDLVEADRNA